MQLRPSMPLPKEISEPFPWAHSVPSLCSPCNFQLSSIITHPLLECSASGTERPGAEEGSNQCRL